MLTKPLRTDFYSILLNVFHTRSGRTFFKIGKWDSLISSMLMKIGTVKLCIEILHLLNRDRNALWTGAAGA